MGCIPMRKPIILSKTDSNSNTNNNNTTTKKSNQTTPLPKPSNKTSQNPSHTSDNSNINLNPLFYPKPKSSIEHHYKIIQKINSLIQNAHKVLHKTTSKPYTMITILRASLENEDDFKSNYDKLLKISHKNLLTVYDLYEDVYCYYLICEYFDGNKLYDECSIEIAKYNEYALSKIIKKIMKAIQTLKHNGISDYYVDPQNVFCNFTSNNNKIIVKVFYNQFFTKQHNHMQDKVKQAFNPHMMHRNKEEWSLGVLMFCMLFGNVKAFVENAFAETKMFVQVKNSLISKRCKELLLSLLQVTSGNGMSCEIGLSCDFIVKANVACLQKLEGKLVKGVKRFFLENCFYYKTIMFCEEYMYMNNSVSLDKMCSDNKGNYSLYNMKVEKRQNEEQDVHVDMITFLNDIRLFRVRQQIHQLRRIYSKIDNSKDNIVLILALSEHDIFKEVSKSISNSNSNNSNVNSSSKNVNSSSKNVNGDYGDNSGNGNKISFDVFFKTLYEKLNDFIANDNNHLIKIIGRFQSIDTKNFNKEFLVIANKWYSSEDCFDMESLINDHCSSSDIGSSVSDENDSGLLNKEVTDNNNNNTNINNNINNNN